MKSLSVELTPAHRSGGTAQNDTPLIAVGCGWSVSAARGKLTIVPTTAGTRSATADRPWHPHLDPAPE